MSLNICTVHPYFCWVTASNYIQLCLSFAQPKKVRLFHNRRISAIQHVHSSRLVEKLIPSPGHIRHPQQSIIFTRALVPWFSEISSCFSTILKCPEILIPEILKCTHTNLCYFTHENTLLFAYANNMLFHSWNIMLFHLWKNYVTSLMKHHAISLMKTPCYFT